jgi:hypothetical protein
MIDTEASVTPLSPVKMAEKFTCLGSLDGEETNRPNTIYLGGKTSTFLAA